MKRPLSMTLMETGLCYFAALLAGAQGAKGLMASAQSITTNHT